MSPYMHTTHKNHVDHSIIVTEYCRCDLTDEKEAGNKH